MLNLINTHLEYQVFELVVGEERRLLTDFCPRITRPYKGRYGLSCENEMCQVYISFFISAFPEKLTTTQNVYISLF